MTDTEKEKSIKAVMVVLESLAEVVANLNIRGTKEFKKITRKSAEKIFDAIEESDQND